MPHSRRLLLLDRDGTLMPDTGYPNDPATVTLMPGAAEAVRELTRRGFVPAVVSNQSGVARGKVTAEQARAVHTRFVELLSTASGVTVPGFYCLHGPDDGCACRKPKPGLLHTAANALGLAGRPAVMIGDKPSDVAAGRAFGADTVLLWHGKGNPPLEPRADVVATDWPMIVRWLLVEEVRRDAG